MQDFKHIETLWASHTVELPVSADYMLKQIKKDVNSIRIKSLLNIFGMCLSIIIIAAVWLFIDFYSYFTHLGISIMILSIAVYTFILFQNHRTLSKTDFTKNPKEFLNNLKVYQLERHQMYNRLYWFYVLALSTGLGLYFYEVTQGLSMAGQYVIVFLSFGWIIFASTVLRKIIIKKDKERINQLIAKFENIIKQFEMNN